MGRNLNWKNILSSLRNGVIPDEGIQFFEVGRDYEIKEFDKVINNLSRKSDCKFISGGFGDGKSFFLKSINEKTLSKKFVVSTVTITPNISLNNLDEIYINIMRNLRCKNANSFSQIVNKWITSLNNKASKKFPDNISKQRKFVEDEIYSSLSQVRNHNPTFADIIKKFYEFSNGSKSDIADYGLNWLTGDSISQSVKKEFGLKGDIDKSNALHYIETLSIFFKAIGYSGFVILFDECEITMDLSVNYRNTAYNNIRDIYDKASSNVFKSTLFVFAGTPVWFDDSRVGIRSNPALYSRIKDPISGTSAKFQKPIINLAKFSKNDLMKLCRKISIVYENVYGEESPNKLSPYVSEIVEPYLTDDFIDNSSLRDFIREYVAYLDVVRENPNDFKVRPDFINLISGVENDDDWL